MTQLRTAYRWRTCDLDSLPDTPWLRYEIIDGELIVSTRPHLQHSEIILRLGGLFTPFVRNRGGKVLQNLGLSGGRKQRITSSLISQLFLPDRLHLTTGRALSGTPNIAIEIVSDSSRTVDYVQKRYLYERIGAQEYWIVDRFVRRIEVWRFTGEHPASVSYSDGDTLTTPLLPDLAIPVHEIWP